MSIAARTQLPTGTWHVDHARPGRRPRLRHREDRPLDRSDWGMTFNQVLGSSNLLISDRVKLQLDIASVKQV
jgi:hypothetical protein